MVQWVIVRQLRGQPVENLPKQSDMRFRVLLKNLWRHSLLVLLLFCQGLLVAADSTPDLSGIWVGAQGRSAQWPTDPPYTAEGAEFNTLASSPSDPVYNCVIGFGLIISVVMPM